MNPEEYIKLNRIEENHWYYRGKREIVKYWLRKVLGDLTSKSLLDCGAGTGVFVSELLKEINCIALDDHKESLEILYQTLPKENVLHGSCTAIPKKECQFDAVTALDVLEHIKNDEIAVSEIIRVTKPGGAIVVTVPAMKCLWSDWDTSLHHHRRYSKESLSNLFESKDVVILHCNYINFVVTPLVWLSRKTRKINIGKSVRAEDKAPHPKVNRILQRIFVREGTSKQMFPFGVGLLLVAIKRSK
jgi:ubiquinone/menaquinone biosynthesis C-methylase UbiE